MLAKVLLKLQSKIVLLLIVSITIPATVISSYSIISSSNTISELVAEKMKDQTLNNSQKIATFLDNVGRDVIYLSKAPPVQGIVRARDNGGFDKKDNSSYELWVNRLKIIFSGMMEAKPYYSTIRYLDENGQERVKVSVINGTIQVIAESELKSKFDRSYFTETMKLSQGEIYASRIDLTEENGRLVFPYIPVIRYGTPIYNEKGQKRGIILANVFAEYFLEKMSHSDDIKKVTQTFVINQDGYYLHHPTTSKEWGFELKKDENIKRDYPEEMTHKILSQDQGLVEDSEHLLSYYTIFPNKSNKDNHFVIVYNASKEIIFGSINQSKVIAFFITVLSLAVVLIVGITILRNIVNSISRLTNIISSFSVQVLSTVDQQERMLSQQSSSVQETTITMNQLNTFCQQSLEQAAATAIGAKQALAKGQEGSQTVEKTLAEIGLLKESVELIAAKILQLNEQTQKIANISSVVTDLANQTNMLALNASVEAVRAGSQGKGFGVVATEIRRFAEYSKQSAQDINNIVSDIQSAIHQTVIVTKEGTKKVEVGVEIAQTTAKAFQDISAAIEQIVTNSQQIALNTQQQAAATEQVVVAMNILNQGAIQVTHGISQTKTGAQQLSETALNLKSMV